MQPISPVQPMGLNLNSIHKRAIGTVEVDQLKVVVDGFNPRVFSGDLAIDQVHLVAHMPADPDRGSRFNLEPRSLIGAVNDEQSGFGHPIYPHWTRVPQ